MVGMKLLYKPFGLAINALAGLAAAGLYKRLWRALTHEKETPKAMDQGRSWRQVLISAAMKGAVFGVVRAASRRSGATGFASLTGTWPGEQSTGHENEVAKPVRRPSSNGTAGTREGRLGRVRKSH
jgi:hypothetical protein